MSVATASAVLRLRLTRTISCALPRLTAAIAQAQPTLPVPIIPIFTDLSVAALSTRRRPDRFRTLYAKKAYPADARASCATVKPSLPRNAGRFEQEPGASLGLVDPVLDQAGAGHVVVFVADRVSLAQARHQLLVVVAQLGKHVQRRDEVGVVVQHPLQATDVADRAQRGAADLAYAFGDVVGGGEDLLALFVEEEMIVPEVRAGHMPMEIFRLQVEREHVGEQDIERAGNLWHRIGAQIGRRIERCEPQRGGVSCLGHGYLLFRR